MTQADADLYNQVQRAHQNTLEEVALYLALLFFGAFSFPAITALFGLVWIVGRIMHGAFFSTGVFAQEGCVGSYDYLG
jgi:glutathione S-transferase